ncbi:DUF5118 domain-containing protein [Polaribacter sejongensis]|uniref:DUF5118 domain-containing protein n=1 Tax=Polaribacter sejongensis TaxID=985043 RepID=UPI0035A58F5F
MKTTSLKGTLLVQNLIVAIFILISFSGFSQSKKENAKKDHQEKKDSIKTTDAKKLTYQKFLKEGNVKKGLFNVYAIKEDYYFEVPDSLLSRDLLIVNKVSSVPYALNGHGLNKGMTFETKLVRFYKDTVLNKVWVKTINPRVQSPENDAITLSVKDNFGESIIEEFEIETKNTDSTSVFIKVNKIFNGKEQSFSDVLTNIGLGEV